MSESNSLLLDIQVELELFKDTKYDDIVPHNEEKLKMIFFTFCTWILAFGKITSQTGVTKLQSVCMYMHVLGYSFCNRKYI